ncbi:MAG: hypothetical protein ACRDRN_00185 [Sciscionella sp.]
MDVVAKRGEVDGVFSGTAPGVEYLAADPARTFQRDDGRPRFADHPWGGISEVCVVERRTHRGRIFGS